MINMKILEERTRKKIVEERTKVSLYTHYDEIVTIQNLLNMYMFEYVYVGKLFFEFYEISCQAKQKTKLIRKEKRL